MTVCAAVPIVNLAKYRHIRFAEPAVILLADSRISFADGRPPDDKGQKVGSLSDFAIAGFAGNVGIAYDALNTLTTEIAGSKRYRPRLVVPRAQTLLRNSWKNARANGLSDDVCQTQVLIATRYDPKRIKLYLLSSQAFIPTSVQDTKAIGSGRLEFEQAFADEFESVVISWQRRALGPRAFQEGSDQYLDDLSVLPEQPGLVSWSDVSLSASAALSEVLDRTQLVSIGGKVQAMALISDRVLRMELAVSKDDGNTWDRASL